MTKPTATVLNADCLDALRGLPDNSIDAIVTDPPYGLSDASPAQIAAVLAAWGSGDRTAAPTGRGFMGKLWDAFVPPPAVWDECLRVLKPGGHLLAFAGSRTFDLMGLSIRLAGFEVRDSVAWLYGSGFPKSNTVLKPAFEPVVLARKPFRTSERANIAEHGTGGLQIEAARIGVDSTARVQRGTTRAWEGGAFSGEVATGSESGRWPSNVILDEDQAAALDAQAPSTGGSGKASGPTLTGESTSTSRGKFNGVESTPFYGGEKGGASRFYYVAKAPKSERPVVDGVAHPTVKPLALMRYLVKLVTPPGGTVLDPFAGSGATVEAALLEGFDVVGIEREADYVPLIHARIDRV